MFLPLTTLLPPPPPKHCADLLCSIPFGVVPGGETATMLVKKIATINCIILLAIFQNLLGIWKPGKDPLGSHHRSK